jgi:hypothetical protein
MRRVWLLVQGNRTCNRPWHLDELGERGFVAGGGRPKIAAASHKKLREDVEIRDKGLKGCCTPFSCHLGTLSTLPGDRYKGYTAEQWR